MGIETIKGLVERFTEHRDDYTSDPTDATDRLVYALYGLTDEEIRIVERP